MTDVVSIQFTQDQTRTLTDVSAETVRHWRKTIPYLSLKTGKSARFTFTDLVGLAVTKELVNSFGININAVSEGVDALFRLLATVGSVSLDGAVALITPTDAMLRVANPGETSPALTKSALVIPLTPLVARIQLHMLPAMPISIQVALPFPPEPVWSRA